jgi:hypothetical protein
MAKDLKEWIRTALQGSSSRAPVDTTVLAKGRRRKRVEAALMEMYQANEVCCCKLFKGSEERVVWWISGAGVIAPITHRTPKGAA